MTLSKIGYNTRVLVSKKMFRGRGLGIKSLKKVERNFLDFDFLTSS